MKLILHNYLVVLKNIKYSLSVINKEQLTNNSNVVVMLAFLTLIIVLIKVICMNPASYQARKYLRLTAKG